MGGWDDWAGGWDSSPWDALPVVPPTVLEQPRAALLLEVWDRGGDPTELADDVLAAATDGVGPLRYATRTVRCPPAARPTRLVYRDLVVADGAAAFVRLGDAPGTTAPEALVQPVGGLVITAPATLGWGAPGSVATDDLTAATFDGVDDIVTIAPHPVFDVTGSVALEATLRTADLPAPSGAAVLVHRQNLSGSGRIALEVFNASGDLVVTFSVHDGTTGWIVASTVDLADDVDHHVLGRRDRGRGVLELWVDGHRVAIAVDPTADAIVTSGPVEIGGSSTASVHYAGVLGNVAWYTGDGLGREQISAHARAMVLETEDTWQGLIVSSPQLNFRAPEPFGGAPHLDSITVEIADPLGILCAAAFDAELRGARAAAHLYDPGDDEPQLYALAGLVAGISVQGRVCSLTITADDVGLREHLVPRGRVNTTDFALAPLEDLGKALATGWGVGRGVPGRYIEADLLNDLHAYGWLGNVGLDAVRVGGIPYTAGVDYDVAPRDYRCAGRQVTAIRLPRRQAKGGQLLPVTADVHGTYPELDAHVLAEFQWRALGFADTTGNHVAGAVAGSPITTAQLASGQSGVGFGALDLNGTTHALELSNPARLQVQRGAIDCEFLPRDQGDTGVQALVKLGDPDGGLTLLWDRATQTVRGLVRQKSPAITVTHDGVPAAAGAWHVATLAWDWGLPTPTATLMLDGLLVATFTGTPGGRVNFDVADRVWIGRGVGGPTPDEYFAGKPGYLRCSDRPRTLAEHRELVARLRRSPIRALWDFDAHELPDEPDVAAFDAGVDAMHAVTTPVGELVLDGWLSDVQRAGDVLDAFGVFFDLRLGRTPAGLAVPRFQQAAATAVGAFSCGPPYNNVVSPPERRKASIAETPSGLVVQYRRLRDASGDPAGFWHERTLHVASVDPAQPTAPLPLALVDAHPCADRLGQYWRALVQAAQDLLTLEVHHAGRFLRPRQVIAASAKPVGIGYLREWLILEAVNARTRASLRLVPYVNPTAYTPSGDLPTDPVIAAPKLTVGNAPEIVATAAGTGSGVNLDVNLADTVTLPLESGSILQWDTVVGGGGVPHVVLGDASDATYVQHNGAGEALVLCPFNNPGVVGTVLRIVVTLRVSTTAAGTSFIVPVLRSGADTHVLTGDSHSVTGSTWVDRVFEQEANPFGAGDDPWTLALLNDLQVGARTGGGGSAPGSRLARMTVAITVRLEDSHDFERVRVWEVISPTTPAAPAISVAPKIVAPMLVGLATVAAGAGTHWYFARVYASGDRQVGGVIGPSAGVTF
jgi:hypothetical protein